MIDACQEYILNHPRKLAESFTESEWRILDYMFKISKRYKTATPMCQTTMAAHLGITTKTVNRCFRALKEKGIIFAVRRFNQSCVVYFTDFFSYGNVREAFYRYFPVLPWFYNSIKMLLTGYVPLDTKKSYDRTLRKQSVLSLSKCKSYAREREVILKLEENSLRKVLAIECALVRLGEVQDNVDTAKLMAFPEECLNFASEYMKRSKPKKPFGFFVKICLDWMRDNNQEPQWVVADHIRNTDLLKHYRPSVQDSIKQQLANMTERKQSAGQKKSYEQEVIQRADVARRQEQKYSDAYENSAAKKRYHEHMAKAAEHMAQGISNPFLAQTIEFMKISLSKYDPLSEEAERIRVTIRELGGSI